MTNRPPMSRTSRTTRRFLRAISRLLPREARADWIDEWSAEIATAQEGGHTEGTLGEVQLLFGAWSDALPAASVRPHPSI